MTTHGPVWVVNKTPQVVSKMPKKRRQAKRRVPAKVSRMTAFERIEKATYRLTYATAFHKEAMHQKNPRIRYKAMAELRIAELELQNLKLQARLNKDD